jgi:hypothetical protein
MNKIFSTNERIKNAKPLFLTDKKLEKIKKTMNSFTIHYHLVQ